MLASSSINPFDTQETRVYKDNIEIENMMSLRQAYQNNDIASFEKTLNDPRSKIKDDAFMREYVNDLLHNMRYFLQILYTHTHTHIYIYIYI